jgi:mRNA interferase RelE/StbE
MAWAVEFDPAAARELKKLDPQASRRILVFLQKRVATASDPRSIGAALKGAQLAELWKYRVGR